jgi:hypothetical protein
VASPPGAASVNSETFAVFSSCNVPATSQTITVDSSPTGDFLNAFGFEFGGVGNLAITITGASSNSTATGSIVGQPVTVPVGSVLFALCFEPSHTIGTPPVVDNGTAAYTNYFNTFGVTFGGTGTSITPLFTASGTAATTYVIAQMLFSPPGTAVVAGSGGGNISGTAPVMVSRNVTLIAPLTA